MTVTEASREPVEAAATPVPVVPPPGLAAVVGSGDPRTVGKLFIGTSLVFLLVAGVAGALVGFELGDASGKQVFEADTTLRVFTLHGTAALLLGVLPLLIGLATAVVPLQVGAATVAFPRASAAAYWVWLVAGGILLASYAIDGGPFGADDDAVGLYVLALAVVAVALFVATLSVVTTVLTLRAPGMSLRRTPLFSWSVLVAGTVWLLTLPVLGGMLLVTYLDLRYGQQFLGGPQGVYDRIAWLFWQPTLYLVAVPALGIVADVVPVFAQRRHQRHGTAMVLLGLLSAVGFGAWAQLGVTIDGGEAPTPWLFEGPWVVVSFLAIVAVLGLVGLWNLTLAAGRPRLSTPLVLAQMGTLAIVVGVVAGGATAIDALDLDGTTWMTAQATMVVGGALVAALGGVAFWAPKLYGKLLPDAGTRLGGTLLLLGILVAAVPQAVAGALGQLRLAGAGLLDAGPGTVPGVVRGDVDTVELLDLVSGVGLAVAVLGGLTIATALLRRRSGEGPGDDPWSGHTLEWLTTSPPAVGHFASLPPITSEAPVYDARHGAVRPADTTEAPA
ncbi:MAG TPA: cbb3-type cytochrome c oxidase subunit I [Acidimicrobiales bacterium]|nr:cbb3-type cytochrome c oxidase subunit I [Acidimicrobiales bacterium]